MCASPRPSVILWCVNPLPHRTHSIIGKAYIKISHRENQHVGNRNKTSKFQQGLLNYIGFSQFEILNFSNIDFSGRGELTTD